MKPSSIKLFDYCYLGSIALGFFGFVSGYRSFKAAFVEVGAESGVALPPILLIGFYVLGAAIGLLLWYLVSVQRLQIAKWIIVLLFLISLIGVGDYFAGQMPLHEIYGLLALIAEAVAVSMLFRSDAIRWLEGDSGGDAPSNKA